MHPVTYWHGGPAGLPVGAVLVPRTQLPALPPAYAAVHPLMQAMTDQASEHDPGYVYVSTDPDLAGQFAGLHALHPTGGALYKVEPLGDLATDPDFPTVGLRCSSARVLSSTPARALQNPHADKRYTTWEDKSTPMYDAEGYAIPSPVGDHLGVTATELRALGPWPEYEAIEQRIGQLVLAARPGLTQQDLDRISRRFLR